MLSNLEASDAAEQEAIMMIQELWQCQELELGVLLQGLLYEVGLSDFASSCCTVYFEFEQSLESQLYHVL